MQCEVCGDSVSLSTARRWDGQFICPDCHANGQQKQQQQAQQTPPSGQRFSAQQHVSSGGDRARQQSERQTRSDHEVVGMHTKRPESSRGQANRSSNGIRQGVSTGAPAEQKFNALRRFGKVLSFGGWIFVLLGGLGSFMGIVWLSAAGESMMAGAAGAMLLPGSVLTLAQGLLLVVLGQQTSCFVAIERNTRSTYKLLQAQQD